MRMIVGEDKNDVQKNTSGSKESRCYICKRTEPEVQEFLLPNLDEIIKRYDSEKIRLESMLQDKKNSLKSYFDKILKSTEKANLDFKIDTVISDIDSFEKIIPDVEELIMVFSDTVRYENVTRNHYKPYSEYGFETLSDMRKNLVELRNEIEDDQFYEKIRKKNLENNHIGSWYSSGAYGVRDVELYEQIRKKDLEFGHIGSWISSSGYYRECRGDALDRRFGKIFNEEIEKIFESLELLNLLRDMHLKSQDQKKNLIKEVRHHQISREIVSPRYIAIYSEEGSEARQRRREMEEHPELHKTPIVFPICAICYTLVWHKSPTPF